MLPELNLRTRCLAAAPHPSDARIGLSFMSNHHRPSPARHASRPPSDGFDVAACSVEEVQWTVQGDNGSHRFLVTRFAGSEKPRIRICCHGGGGVGLFVIARKSELVHVWRSLLFPLDQLVAILVAAASSLSSLRHMFRQSISSGLCATSSLTCSYLYRSSSFELLTSSSRPARPETLRS